MEMELMRFVFQDGLHFWGTVLILVILLTGIYEIVGQSISSIATVLLIVKKYSADDVLRIGAEAKRGERDGIRRALREKDGTRPRSTGNVNPPKDGRPLGEPPHQGSGGRRPPLEINIREQGQ